MTYGAHIHARSDGWTYLGEDLLLELQTTPRDGVHRQLAAHWAARVRDLKVTAVLRTQPRDTTQIQSCEVINVYIFICTFYYFRPFTRDLVSHLKNEENEIGFPIKGFKKWTKTGKD